MEKEQVKTQEPKQQQEKQEKQVKTPKGNHNEEVDDWRTRINWEKIYKNISIIIVCLIPFFIRDMLSFRQKVQEDGLQVVSWFFMIYAFIAMCLFTIVRKLYFLSTHNFIMSKILPQYLGEDRVLHTRKVQKWTFDCLYYSLTSLYGYICFRDATWYPITFSKEADDTLGLFEQWPNVPDQQSYYKYFDLFLVIQFGHHAWGVLDLVFVRRHIENRFYEWFLHHILAFTLIFYSLYYNFAILAVSVLIIHDIGDIAIVLFKTYGEFSDKGVTFKFLVFNMISQWFLSRVYLYPKVIIIPIITNAKLNPDNEMLQMVMAGYTYCTIMLSVLYVLHIYWFAQMVTLLSQYIKKSLKKKQLTQKKLDGYGNPWDYKVYTDAEKKQQAEDQKKKDDEEEKKNKSQ